MYNSGILLINKPERLTSAEVLNHIKKQFRLKKIGHAGTLDAFATGLLIAGVNEGTKILPLFMERDKIYITTLILGEETDTLESSGLVIYRHKGALPGLIQIEKVLTNFIGEVLQIPPSYSAIKINGKRASDRVREGEKISMKARLVRIDKIEILHWTPPELTLKVYCGKGTYIRSLARDMGRMLGCGAFVKSLERIEISPYTVGEGKNLEEILKEKNIENIIIPMKESLPFVEKVILEKEESESLKKGRFVEKEGLKEASVAIALTAEDAIGIVKIEKKGEVAIIKPVRIFK